jgi:hypothetical protein
MRRHLELIPQVDFESRHDPTQCGQLAALIPGKLLMREAIRDALRNAIRHTMEASLRREAIGDALRDALRDTRRQSRIWST